jgi:hypothetical protein
VRFRLSKEFLEERTKFVLVHTCEYCVHFNPGKVSCVHGYPVDDHVTASLERDEAELVFCKEFELI